MFIRTKFHISIIFVICTVFAIGSILIHSYLQTIKNTENHRLIDEVLTGTFELSLITNDYLLYHDETTIAQWPMRSNSLAHLLTQLEFVSREERLILERLREGHQGIISLYSQLQAFYEKGKTHTENDLIRQEWAQRLVGQISIKTQSMISDATWLDEQSDTILSEIHRRSGMRTTGMVVLMGIVLIVIYEGIRRSLFQLTRLRDGAKIIGNGDFEHRVEIDSHDEIGQLSLALNEMSHKLRGSYEALRDENLERRQTEEALLKSRKNYKEIVEGTADLVTRVNSEGRFTYINYLGEKIFGIPVDQCIGRPAFDFIHPGDRKATITWFNECTSKGIQQTSFENRQVNKKNGAIFHMLWTSCFYYDENGQLMEMAGIAHDITEREKAEEEKRKLEKQIRHVQKLESLGVLAGGIAHDFNNIITAILGNADLALAQMSTASPARENIVAIEAASRRAADLCRQMLAYSGKGRFEVKSLNLSELVQEMTHMLEVSISKKAALKLNTAENLPAIKADATQIHQIVMNLIVNASEAIGDKNGIISITTGTMECDLAYLAETYHVEKIQGGAYVYLEVTDTGCGMSKETQTKLFDPFFSTKLMGRGLGMSAVQGIIRGHKGAIKICSEPDRGTTVKILFPALKEIICEEHAVDVKENAKEWQGKGTVLLVDDEEMVRTVAKKMLEHLGLTVLTAEDGEKAIDIFREQGRDIDCVILDLTMPQMDGEETYREMRRIQPNVRVVMSSGYNKEEVSQHFVGEELASFIQKPYKMTTLKERLHDLFNKT